MKSTIAILIIITVISCAAVSFNTKDQVDTKGIAEDCFDKELVNCGDKICEMSTDNPYDILYQVKINVLTCIEDKLKNE